MFHRGLDLWDNRESTHEEGRGLGRDLLLHDTRWGNSSLLRRACACCEAQLPHPSGSRRKEFFSAATNSRPNSRVPFFDFRDVSPAVCGPALALLSKSQHRTAVSWQRGNSAWPPPFSRSPPHAGLMTTHDQGPAGLISQIRLRVTWLQSWDQHLTQSDCKAQPTLSARSPPFPFIPLHTVPSSLLPFLPLPPPAWADAGGG